MTADGLSDQWNVTFVEGGTRYGVGIAVGFATKLTTSSAPPGCTTGATGESETLTADALKRQTPYDTFSGGTTSLFFFQECDRMYVPVYRGTTDGKTHLNWAVHYDAKGAFAKVCGPPSSSPTTVTDPECLALP
ncbi:hypothetical protein BH09MYX1_BH09MYX1_04980 [soil metagenome]